jgi:hypothetical protein
VREKQQKSSSFSLVQKENVIDRPEFPAERQREFSAGTEALFAGKITKIYCPYRAPCVREKFGKIVTEFSPETEKKKTEIF